jgi:GT2 family glycosyltransferase
MISLIVCSIDAAKFAAVSAMYRVALGEEPFEVIGIHDARSLAEGYNRGVDRARGEILVFSHDDVEILNPDFAGRLKKHLVRYDLVGVAGTSRLLRAFWPAAGIPYIFGQVAHPLADGQIRVDIYGAPRPVVGKIQALDGLFMAARRGVLDRVRFDSETFDAFHLYDVDFSHQVYRAGMAVAVANDINLFHHSHGQFEAEWQKYVERFTAKWARIITPTQSAPFQWAAAIVATKAHALDVMSPWHWNKP